MSLSGSREDTSERAGGLASRSGDTMIDSGSFIGGRYRVGPVIGRGGMAEVRAGCDTRLDRPVAIKLLRADIGHQPEVRRRFESEARLAARLLHPNVVTVFDSGEHGPCPYIVMEQLRGWTLRDQLQGGPLPVPAVGVLALEVLAALAAAHDAGILHRDVKPSNILVGASGQWKVADFGIAKLAELPGADDTVSGVLMGTPAYLAPERFFGAPATVEADLYAVGAVLYEALTGRKPVEAGDAPGAWPAVAATTPPAPLRSLRPDVDPDLAAVTERCLAKDPGQRFPSAAEASAGLSSTPLGPPPIPSRPVATVRLEATEALPGGQQPTGAFHDPARSRRRVPLGIMATVALVAILAAVVGLYAATGPGGRPDPTPPTSVATPPTSVAAPPTSVTAPPTSVLTPPTSVPTIVTAPPTVPPATPPTTVNNQTLVTPTAPAAASPHGPGRGHHGGDNQGKGGGSNGNGD